MTQSSCHIVEKGWFGRTCGCCRYWKCETHNRILDWHKWYDDDRPCPEQCDHPDLVNLVITAV